MPNNISSRAKKNTKKTLKNFKNLFTHTHTNTPHTHTDTKTQRHKNTNKKSKE